MPKIPEGNFRAVPRADVGANTASPAAKGGINAAKAGAAILEAQAILQDQNERADAFEYAKNVKQEYDYKKAQFLTALKTVQPDGSYSYKNPQSIDPATNQPVVEEGNIHKKYQELQDIYIKGIDSSSELIREDIARNLLDDNIGNDLISMTLKTGVAINKSKAASITNGFRDLVDSELASMIDPDFIHSKDVALKVQKKASTLQNNLKHIAPSLGNKARAAGLYRDDKLIETAKKIIKLDFTEKGIRAAEAVIAQVQNQLKLKTAAVDLRDTVKIEAEKASGKLIDRAEELSNTVKKADYIGVGESIKGWETVNNLATAYIHPEFSTITKERARFEAAKAAGNLIGKALLQSKLDKLEFEKNLGKYPSAEVLQDMERYIEASQLSDQLKLDNAFMNEAKIHAQTFMQTHYKAHVNNAAAIIEQSNPELQDYGLYNELNSIYEVQGEPDLPFVSPDKALRFRESIKFDMTTNPSKAYDDFKHTVDKAKKYGKAVITDLVGDDSKLNYLIPITDFSGEERFQLFKEAAELKGTMERKGVSSQHVNSAWNENYLDDLTDVKDSQYITGLKKLITNKAVANADDADDLDSAMGDAVKWFNNNYAIVETRGGRSQVVAAPTGNQKWNRARDKHILGLGMTVMSGLPFVDDRDEKMRALVKAGWPDKAKMSDKTMDLWLPSTVRVYSDPRRKNVVMFYYKDTPLTDANGNAYETTIEELYSAGQAELERRKKNEMWRYR
jgi:hypothetical protein